MLSENGKKIILGDSDASITEKKSRFIAACIEVHSEEEALKNIEKLRKQYFDARHNCYAYVVGANSEIQRFSDDKEPQGTAGKPILDVLLSNNITNALIVVTRYFGGILLGAGGLVRAYSSAAALGIKNSCVLPLNTGDLIDICCDYNSSGKIRNSVDRLSEHSHVYIKDISYTENVTFTIICESACIDSLLNRVTEITSGKAVTENKGAVSFVIRDGSPEIYSF